MRKKYTSRNGQVGIGFRLFPQRGVRVWRLWGVRWLMLFLSVPWGWAHEGVHLAPAPMVRQRIEGKAPELALIDQFSRQLMLTELQGKVVLLTFTYSTCADVCPLITAAMVTLQQRLTAAERQGVFFLSVTTDPEVDTPSVLLAYAKRLGADLASWAFLTGHPPAVQEVWQAYGLTVRRRAEGRVDHPALTLLIDRDGMARYRYLGSLLEVETILQDIHELWEGGNLGASSSR